MNMRNLIPWNRGGGRTPAVYREDNSPFLALHREMNRLFDDVFRNFDAPAPFSRMSGWSSWPDVEVSETDGEIRVTAEVPGLEEKDMEVLLKDGVLTLRGEKKSEAEDKDRQFSERFYGRFERHIGLGPEVDEDRVAADFRNGVLTVTLPKTEQAKSSAKRIAINGGR
ncbi:Hsp20/alpha crystallin family protein [Chelativorans salis]|uniref:Hsp20/alpha crystallin family protein n=1 Tax=Chelativorans salis TaxID=2978478 RepID=A0ABT2LL93_9HYPH|nr:Hsp20/alpha crystallin family protein [Chelativorans sp. EGI FJ00035]MCT7374819.1 Hsp20/alpha crystallin family protein [Chelativorans sp. EGI FJ00035]